ncbi:MAG TPA: ADP-glyceromanno-heptose 6-epimerase [Bacteroidales bacterium]|nr:ADP-glyceromanno-heptose 6-epimerase [Bacteroidales bacterium]
MIIVTGAAGFIGSCLVNKLNNKGFTDIVLVDDFSSQVKNLNLTNKIFRKKVDRTVLFEWLSENYHKVSFVFHLGARTDTTEFRKSVFDELNLNYSKQLWNNCVKYELPLVYASSAATYGAGEHGYDDDHAMVGRLKPLNPYGESKNDFDKWVLEQKNCPYFWAGIKFFNVFGPNEYHKGRMASVVLHTYRQISQTERMELFRSHRPDFSDGGQSRDFIYVKDVVNVLFYFLLVKKHSGIYNLGTGQARTFLDLAKATFKALDKEPRISFIDTPGDIRDTYQYYTRAKMDKLFGIGFKTPFYTLEEAITDYVQDYLMTNSWY